MIKDYAPAFQGDDFIAYEIRTRKTKAEQAAAAGLDAGTAKEAVIEKFLEDNGTSDFVVLDFDNAQSLKEGDSLRILVPFTGRRDFLQYKQAPPLTGRAQPDLNSTAELAVGADFLALTYNLRVTGPTGWVDKFARDKGTLGRYLEQLRRDIGAALDEIGGIYDKAAAAHAKGNSDDAKLADALKSLNIKPYEADKG